MYRSEFIRLLQKGIPAKSFLLYGEEPYFIHKYSSLLADKIAPKENRLLLYHEEYDFKEAKNHLSQASLFGDSNLLIVKSQKPLAKKELQTLIELCYKMPQSYFIFELYSNEGKRIASAFDKKRNALEVRFFPPKEHEALNELQELAKELSISIDEGALRHLLRLLENNLALAAKELEKLSCYERVGIKEIESLVYPLNPLNLFKLYEALFKKKPLEEFFAKLEEEEQNEMKILLGLQNFLQQLFLFYSYIRLHGKADSKEILGYKLPSFVEEERVRLAIRIKNYPQIFLELQECEYLLKTKPNIDKSALLLSTLIKIQGLIR